MMIAQKVKETEAQAKKAGLTPQKLCDLAKINRTTYQRWKAGKTQPLWDSFARLENVIKEAGL